jgi:hypothetical protein
MDQDPEFRGSSAAKNAVRALPGRLCKTGLAQVCPVREGVELQLRTEHMSAMTTPAARFVSGPLQANLTSRSDAYAMSSWYAAYTYAHTKALPDNWKKKYQLLRHLSQRCRRRTGKRADLPPFPDTCSTRSPRRALAGTGTSSAVRLCPADIQRDDGEIEGLRMV